MRARRWGTAMLLAALLQTAPQVMALPDPMALAADKPLQDDPLLAGAERFEQGAKEISEVNLDKNMLRMAAGFLKGENDAEGLDLAKKMEFVYVRSFTYASDGQYRLADLESFRARFGDAGWSHMIRERSATETTDVWIKTDGAGQFNELVVIEAEPRELNFVHLKGHMSMDELSRAGAKFGVPQAKATEPKTKGGSK